MPQPITYTPRRKMLMHLCMWLILLLTLIAAGSLSTWKANRWKIDLQPPVAYGHVQLALPAQWSVQHRHLLDADILVARDQAGHELTLRSFRNDAAETPLEFLISSGTIPPSALESNSELLQQAEEIELNNGQGLMLHLTRSRVGRRGTVAVRFESIACLLFQDGRGVLIQLSGAQASAADDALLLQIAESVQLLDASTPTPPAEDESL